MMQETTTTMNTANLTFIPRGYVVPPGQTVVLVALAEMGPIPMWPGSMDRHPGHIGALVIDHVIGEPYTVQPDEVWIAGYPWPSYLPNYIDYHHRHALVGGQVSP